jgi:glycosyltransferase involved in cell wall biosynthesis
MKQKRIWISWERQRRTIELAKYFNCDLYLIIFDGNTITRYLRCLFVTFYSLLRERPTTLFVQNPSLLLSVFAILLKPFFGYLLIVDRHTNFKFDKRKSPHFKWRVFWCLSNFTLKYADYTIVTNKPLQRIINFIGAKGLVLQDKFPQMEAASNYPLQKSCASRKALFVCTYAYDEPVDEVIQAFSDLGTDYDLYLSGNWNKKWSVEERLNLPPNVIPTGFISEDEYKSLMQQVDAIIVFTTNDYTLTCGAYEAVTLRKPALLSNKKVLQEYFGKTCVYCDESSIESIKQGIHAVLRRDPERIEAREKEIEQLDRQWIERAKEIKVLFS